MRSLFLLAALCAACVPIGASAQTSIRTLTGSIVASDGTSLPGATVTVPRLSVGALAGADGQFRLAQLPSDTLTIHVRFVGFESIRRVVDLRSGDVSVRFEMVAEVDEAGEVVVTEDTAEEALERSSQSVARLDAAELADVRGQTLGQTLERVPGVASLATGPSISKPVIRGLHSDRVVVVRSGIVMQGQQWGAEHAPEVDPFAPARVEVVRGAAGVEYGAGAIGGVVRLEDAALPTSPGWGGRVALNAFSNSEQLAGTAAIEGASSAIPGLGVRAQVSLRRAGDARTPDYVLGNTAFFERAGEVAAAYVRGDWEIEAHASAYRTDLGIYRGSHFNTFAALDEVIATGRPSVDYQFDYAIDAPKQVVAHDLTAVRLRRKLPGGASAQVQYGYQQNRRREFDSDRLAGRDPLARPQIDLTLQTHTLDAVYRHRPVALAGGDALWTVGLSGETQGNTNAVGYLVPNSRMVSGGAFGRGLWTRGDVTLEAGLRWEAHDLIAHPRAFGGRGDFERTDRAWNGASAAVGALWRFDDAWSIGGNASLAWRPPGPNELFSYGVHHGTGQFEFGNADLGAERSYGIDATLRHQSAHVRGEASVYANQIDDYLLLLPQERIVVTIRGVFPAFAHEQTDALLIGADGGLEVDVSRVTLGGAFSLLRGTDRGRDQPLFEMPSDRVRLSAEYALPNLSVLRGPSATIEATHVLRQTRFPTTTDDTGAVVALGYADPPPAYTLWSARVQTDVAMGRGRPVRVSLGVDNLFDTAYRDALSRYRLFAHDAGRNVSFRVDVPLGRGDHHD